MNDRQEFRDRINKMKLANTVLEAVIGGIAVASFVGVLAVVSMYFL